MATTVFSDPVALTFFDAEHSADENRYLTIGFVSSGTMIVVAHTERGDSTRLISARNATSSERRAYSDANNNDDMLPEYDFASMGTPERGKHFAKFQRYVRTIRLPDDLADRFPDEKSVLEALRRDAYGPSTSKNK